MTRFKITLLFLLLISIKSWCQDTIRYQVTFTNAVHHECLVSILLNDVPDAPLKLIMSSSSPGRYANHEFAKNVYGVSALNINDQEILVQRTGHSEWTLTPQNGYVKIYYSLYANHPDGTYSGIDRNYTLFNMPASFVWIAGKENTPIKIDFGFHESRKWKIATQLVPRSETSFYAPNLEYFLDSPIVLADFDKREFEVSDNGQIKKVKIVFNPSSNKIVEDQFTEMVRKVVYEQKAIFGELPDYDFGEYTFLCNSDSPFIGDAMEHRNSTMITNSAQLRGNEINLMGSVSHEFFHGWNIERIRPKSLEPFDFTKVNQSEELWFGEGFTEYYGDLTLARAGILSQEAFINQMTGVLNYVLNSPGTRKHSLVEMSQMAPFTDASSFIDETNFQNIFTNYYYYGASIALALDLSLRSQFQGISLDNYMKLIWQEYGKKEIPYTINDLKNVLAKLTGDVQFSESFFNQYIEGLEVPNFELLFQKAGFSLMIPDTTLTDLNKNQFRFEGNRMTYRVSPKERTTFYVAGLNKDDIIISINDEQFNNSEALSEFFKTRKIGDFLQIKFIHDNIDYASTTLVKPERKYSISDDLKSHGSLTESQHSIREGWLGSKVSE